MTKNTPMMEMTRQYGHTVYTISAFGSPESACTYEDRLLNLIQHEAEKSSGDKMLHQTAAQSATSASEWCMVASL